MKSYYIAGNRAFSTRAAAEKYCMDCDFDFSIIIEVKE